MVGYEREKKNTKTFEKVAPYLLHAEDIFLSLNFHYHTKIPFYQETTVLR